MTLRTLIALACLVPLAACEDEGPFERAGAEIDEAIENVEIDSETFGSRVDDAVDDLREGVENAIEELER